MPEKKKIGRDFPLSPTSAPKAVDNTRVQKRNYSAEAAAPHYKRSSQALSIAKDIAKEAAFNTKEEYKSKRYDNANYFANEGLKEKRIADSLRKQK